MLTPRLHSLQWLSSAGLQTLGYKEWGNPDNPHVVICSHGLTRVSQDFHDLAQDLGKDVRVVAPDMPGRGRSDWLPDPSMYGIANYVAAAVTLLARVNASTVDWVGTSMGGLIGIGLASLPKNPIRKLLLNDVGPRLSYEALQRIGQYVGQTIRFKNLQEGIAYIKAISASFGPHTDAQWEAMTKSVMVEAEDGLLKCHYDPAIAVTFKNMTPEFAQMAEASLWAAYDQIKAETLIVRGEHSDLLSVETATEMQQRGPKPTLVEFKGVGHAPTFMNELQIATVREFLSG